VQGTNFIPAGQQWCPRMTFVPNPNYRKPKGLPYPVKLPPEYELDEEGRAVLKKEPIVADEPEKVETETQEQPVGQASACHALGNCSASRRQAKACPPLDPSRRRVPLPPNKKDIPYPGWHEDLPRANRHRITTRNIHIGGPAPGHPAKSSDRPSVAVRGSPFAVNVAGRGPPL